MTITSFSKQLDLGDSRMAYMPQGSVAIVLLINYSHKRTLANLCQETSVSWLKLLSITFPGMKTAPKATVILRPFKMLHERCFLALNLFDSDI